MKKYVVCLLCLASLLVLTACGTAQSAPQEPEKEVADSPVAPETVPTTPVEFSNGRACVSLALPEGWEYEPIENSDMGIMYGIRFRPTELTEVTVINEPFLAADKEPEPIVPTATIGFFNGPFGVCGTGLAEESKTLSDGTEVRVGYYDGSPNWSFVSFRAANETLAAINDGLVGQDAEDALALILAANHFPA